MKCYAEQQNLTKLDRGTSGAIPICVATLSGFFIGDEMKRIPLTQGQFAIVDNKDFEWLNQWKWNADWNKDTQSFYARRNSREKEEKDGKQHPIYMAREVLSLKRGDKRQADHIDHNTLDNCISNLRIVTHNQNRWNRRNAKGYSWNNRARKFQAQIMVNSKNIFLGYFHTTKAARNAYLKAKKIYHRF